MKTILLVCGAWGGSLLLLLGLGAFLSQATLRAAERVPTHPSGQAQGSDASLRRVYKAVLWLSCVYYWISIPSGDLSPADQEEVWGLFENREEIEQTFTRAVCNGLGLPEVEGLPATA